MAHDLIPLKFPSTIANKIFFKTYIPFVLKKSKLIISNSNATSKELIKTYKILISDLSSKYRNGFPLSYGNRT